MKPSDDFAAFILTHRRPDRVYTAHSIKAQGYTGRWYVVVDDEDPTLPQYQQTFGARVLTFSKAAIAETFDEADNFNDRRAIVYARNACFALAKQVGVRYFIQLDDDYTGFYHKITPTHQYLSRKAKNLDAVWYEMLEWYKTIPAHSIAMCQGGDWIGGGKRNRLPFHLRKAMNSFICDAERPFSFVGRVNEDVNTYCSVASRGAIFITIPNVSLIQKQTQSNAGGMSELYHTEGTYRKSFYTIMMQPSSVKVEAMKTTNTRLHHSISWQHTVPCIIPQHYRKANNGRQQ